MFGFSTIKLIGAGVGLLALIAFGVLVFSWKSDRDKLLEWQGQVVAATSEASGLKDAKGKPLLLKPIDVPLQIRYLGQTIQDMSNKARNAMMDDLLNARKVEAANEQKGNASAAEFEASLRAIRARYADLMRGQSGQTTANSSGSGGKDLSGASVPTERAVNACAKEGLPSEDALIATEQAYQLDAILNWAKAVGVSRQPTKADLDPHAVEMLEMHKH